MQSFSGCSTNTIKNKLQSLRLFRNSPTLPPQVPSLYWVPRITRGPWEGQCFCTWVLFPQLDHKKWKHSSFPPLQAEFSLMAELKSAMKRIQTNELRPLHKGGRAGGRQWEGGRISVGTKTTGTGGFGSSFAAVSRDSPYSAAVLTKMVFASPDRHFCQPSTSVLGLNPTKHMKGIPAYQASRIPYPGNKSKAVASCGQSTAGKNAAWSPHLILFRPLDRALASSKLTFCAKTQYTYWDHVQEWPFLLLPPGRKPSRLCFVSWAPERENQDTGRPPHPIRIHLSCFASLSSSTAVSHLQRSTWAQHSAESWEKQDKENGRFESW